MDSHQPKGANSCPPITYDNDELDQLNLCRSFLMNLVLTWARIKKSRVAAEVGERLSAIQRHRHQPFNHLREVFFRELSWQIKFDLLKFVCSHLFRSKVGDPLWEGARLLEPVHLGLLLQVVLHLGEDHVQHRYNDIISSTLSSFSPLQHYTVDITKYKGITNYKDITNYGLLVLRRSSTFDTTWPSLSKSQSRLAGGRGPPPSRSIVLLPLDPWAKAWDKSWRCVFWINNKKICIMKIL